MTARKKPSPEEIERQLLDDAGNPDAWEPIATVAASRSPRPAWYELKAQRALKSASRTADVGKDTPAATKK